MSTSPPAFVLTQSPTSQKYRPRFYPRKYPALKFLMIVLYVCAGLCALSLVISLVLLFAGSIAIFAASDRAGGAGVANLFVALVVIIVHAAWIIGFTLPAELIKLLLDIQANTQEAAHHSRLAN